MIHKRTPGERIKKFLEMPHLKRRERNQRLAIVGVIVLLGVYLVLMSLMDTLSPSGSQSSQGSPATKGMQRKR